MNPEKTYNKISKEYTAKIADLKRRIALYGWSRLILFIIAIAGIWYFNDQVNVAIGIGVVCFAIFLIVVRRHVDLKAESDRSRRIRSYADFEISFLSGKTKGYDTGTEFIDPSHPYTSDLDIFGPSSIFEYLNRTKSRQAKGILANLLRRNETDPRAILERRELIKEFGNKPEFIFNYLAVAEIAEEERISESSSTAPGAIKAYPKWAMVLLTLILPAIMLSLTLIFILDLIEWAVYFQLVLLSAIPVMVFLKKNMTDFKTYEDRLKTAAAYNNSLALLRGHEAKSDSLKELFHNADLAKSEGALESLKKINGAIDSRNNIFVGIILNLLLLWDFQCHRRLANWDREWSQRFNGWIGLAHQMEALFSQSIYVHNHQGFHYPELTIEKEFILQEANHILLHENGVTNDFLISGKRKFIIVTGANMAGKSTFLRTVGTNLLLAMSGLPVPAKLMRFRPTQIFTSMVTADNLGEGESYFFSELKRLKELTTYLEEGKALFVILDEILKGTNSVDKAEGSRLFMEKLLDLPARGLIATHDLSLCEMQNDHPQAIKNYSFEVEFRNDDLHFDYKLREGVCQNMNARFLLERMGLTKTTSPIKG
ncbi:hypothetical protein O3Q51_01630 [Cryomorphaceae bacterium 1068]|nr:hypothetical protein [Cryomorphaceae bacterium 1068]